MWDLTSNKPYNYLEDYLVDEDCQVGEVPIVLDLNSIPTLEYIRLETIDDRRKAFLENLLKKEIKVNCTDGYNRVTMRCPNMKHDLQTFTVQPGKDPSTAIMKCDKCIQERILEIDQERHLRAKGRVKKT